MIKVSYWFNVTFFKEWGHLTTSVCLPENDSDAAIDEAIAYLDTFGVEMNDFDHIEVDLIEEMVERES